MKLQDIVRKQKKGLKKDLQARKKLVNPHKGEHSDAENDNNIGPGDASSRIDKAPYMDTDTFDYGSY